jgi:hypothetical protein
MTRGSSFPQAGSLHSNLPEAVPHATESQPEIDNCPLTAARASSGAASRYPSIVRSEG